MTKFEEQEQYYDSLVDKLCALDEASQREALMKMDEATAQNVMKAMVKKIEKGLNSSSKALTKLMNKVPSAGETVIKKFNDSGLPKDIDKVQKRIKKYQKDFLGTEGILNKILNNTDTLSDEQKDELNNMTAKDVKQLKKTGEYQANTQGR